VAIVKPFRALRPRPEAAERVASVPYDVVNTAEAKRLAEGNPVSFLRVVRSEIELQGNPYDPGVYRHALTKLRAFVGDGIFLREEVPAIYIYQLEMQGHVQTGIVGCVSLDEYEKKLIKVHEKTRPDKEDDRTRHIEALEAQAEPVFLAYRAREKIRELIRAEITERPLYNFHAPDEVRHTVWRARKSAEISRAFLEVPESYIADGHHRSASADRARKVFSAKNSSHNGDEAYNYFLGVLFPDDECQILPYNRAIKSCDLAAEEILDACGHICGVQETATGRPSARGEIRMYLDKRWFKLTPHAAEPGALDVDMLQKQILEPVFGIGDPRTDKNLDFIGGARGVAELERLVSSGEALAAFSLYPVSLHELFEIADRNGIMPPKSTWFEPKLRSGIFIHPFRQDFADPESPFETL